MQCGSDTCSEIFIMKSERTTNDKMRSIELSWLIRWSGLNQQNTTLRKYTWLDCIPLFNPCCWPLAVISVVYFYFLNEESQSHGLECQRQCSTQTAVATHLVNFIPALRVLCSQRCMIVKQSFGDFRIGLPRDRDVDGSEILTIAIIRRCSELEESSVQRE